MGTLSAIAAIISITATLAGTAMNVNSLLFNKWLNSQNSSIRSAVRDLISKYNEYFSHNRTAFNTALGKLNNKGTAAFQTWVSHNPVLMSSAKDFLSGYDELSNLQSEQTKLENIIANLQNNLNSLGYTSSRSTALEEADKKAGYEKELAKAKTDYDDLSKRVNNVSFKTVNPHTVNTSHLDAVSQNISGGLKQ